MRRAAAIVLATLVLVLSACSAGTGKYQTMSPEEVKAFKEEHPNALYVDVRTQEEYENIHISTTMTLPLSEIGNTQPEDFPNLEEHLLVYGGSEEELSLIHI